MKKQPREDEIRIAAEAARWQQVLQHGDPEMRAEFADWIKASPRHLREFLFMEALDAAAENIDPGREIDASLDFSALDENVITLSDASHGSLPPVLAAESRQGGSKSWLKMSSRSVSAVAVAAGLLGATLGLVWWLMPGVLGGWERYSTAVGEQRTVELKDGSVLQLNTRSRVQVHLTDRSREIRLQEGEALFKVAHDASRPFRVHTDDAVIRAIGTQFNVYRRSNSTAVAVIEGKVAILPVINETPANSVVSTAPGTASAPGTATPHSSASPAPPRSQPDLQRPARATTQAIEGIRGEVQYQYLAAGEAARIEGSGEIVRDVVADISEATAWRQRRLVFREETLANIAEEFNRYNRSPQIVVEGDAARSRRYGGTFDADDPDSLVQFVTRKDDLEVERSALQIVIRAQ